MNIAAKLNAHLWVRHPDDYYIEPAWCSERLFAVEKFSGWIVDPACGSGRIIASAHAAGLPAYGTDKVKRSDRCDFTQDFLSDNWFPIPYRVDNMVSNPPFGVAQKFAETALERARKKVALLLPTAWVQGNKRSRWLATTPLRRVLFIAPRPSMPPGPVIEAGIEPGGGTMDYAWFIWHLGFDGKPELGWLWKGAA